jgi:hypothetical protein
MSGILLLGAPCHLEGPNACHVLRQASPALVTWLCPLREAWVQSLTKPKKEWEALGGRDQDYSWKPAPANSSRNPILKKPITKKGLVE